MMVQNVARTVMKFKSMYDLRRHHPFAISKSVESDLYQLTPKRFSCVTDKNEKN